MPSWSPTRAARWASSRAATCSTTWRICGSHANISSTPGTTRDSGYVPRDVAASTVSLTRIRRTIVAAQGFAGRYRRADDIDVEAAIRRLSAVQLDSISTVDRAHRLTISSRVGAFPATIVAELLREGRVF